MVFMIEKSIALLLQCQLWFLDIADSRHIITIDEQNSKNLYTYYPKRLPQALESYISYLTDAHLTTNK